MTQRSWAAKKPREAFSNFQFLISNFDSESGGAGRIRTADKQFRKLLLYPSELQPRSTIVILTGHFRSACVFQSDAPGAPGIIAARFVYGAGATFVMRRLRKIVGQYSRSALPAVFSPMRIP